MATTKKWPKPQKLPAHERKKNPKFYGDNFHAFVAEVLHALDVNDDARTPASYDKAIASPEAAEWIKAMRAEYGALDRNSTFELALLPAGLRAIRSKWLFKIKRMAKGIIDHLKARWVGKGYAQQHGIDYDETFLLVVTMEHLRQLLALVAILDLKVHQMDIENTFLNAMLLVPIYIKQPQGFVDPERPKHVCLLRKSLYGLKQAPLEWNCMMDRHLCAHGFLPTRTDPCIYLLQSDSAVVVVIAIYVDDCVIIASPEHVERAKAVLHDGFRMKDLGEAKSILGVEVMRDRDRGALYLRQAGKIMEILHDFGMADAKGIGTPMDPGLTLLKLECMAPEHLRLPYRSVVGRLSYLSQATRPDITFAVNVLSRHINGYDQSHWGMVKHLLRYLHSTKDLAIKYAAVAGSRFQMSDLLPVGYADADWGGDTETRRSTSGVLFTLGGGPIHWGARTQKCVATSTAEAELNAIMETIKEAVHLNGLTRELFPHVNSTIQLFCDNQSTVIITQSKPGEHTQWTKHYSLKLAFLCENVEQLNVDFKYLPTEVMPTDVFTKALGRACVIELRSLINLVKPKVESKGRVV